MPNQSIINRLRKQIRKKNKKLVIQAVISGLMGLGTTLFLSTIIFLVAWFVCAILGLTIFGASIYTALLCTVLFVVVAFGSAIYNVNPLEGVAPPPEKHPTVQWLEKAASTAAGVRPVDPRYASVGAAVLLLSGPENVLFAIRAMRHRFPTDDDRLGTAIDLLRKCKGGLPLKKIRDTYSLLLLKRLILIRETQVSGQAEIELNDRGDTLLQTRAKKVQPAHKSG